jgi:ankyrin repeat protein
MIENGELDPTGLHQDCLGMTPLHILACSIVHSLELYQLMIENYPSNLIVEDAWRATPLLYAIWDAPNEIVEFLVKSYQSLYPNHEFDWNDMVITLGRANASTAVIQNLLDIQQSLSPEFNIDWDQILGVFAIRPARPRVTPFASSATFCFLTRCSIAARVSAIDWSQAFSRRHG